MTEAARGSSSWVWMSVSLLGVVVLNYWFAADSMLDASITSYGKMPPGYGALHDMLQTLHPRVGRSRSTYSTLSTSQVLWLLQPELLSPARPPGEDHDRHTSSQDLNAWLERGGTALVFGGEHSDWQSFGLELASDSAPERPTSQGTLGPGRALELENLRRFAANDAFTTVVSVAGAPFVVSKSIGRGTLIAIADGLLFDNQHLDLAEHSNVAVDLARAYGPPLFDEYSHGLVEQNSLFEALGRARSTLLGSTLVLWALLLVVSLRSVPAAKRAGPRGPEPGLASFVEPLAVLYGRKAPRYAAAVYHAYLYGVRYRLRHVLHGPRGASDGELDRRLDRDLADDPALRDALRGVRVPSNERELEESVRSLEGYVAVVVRTHGKSGR